MNNFIAITMLGAAAMALHVPAHAQTASASGGPKDQTTTSAGQTTVRPFKDLDSNSDMGLNEQEYGAIKDSSRTFSSLDTNRDRRLSEDEYRMYDQQDGATAPGTKGNDNTTR